MTEIFSPNYDTRPEGQAIDMLLLHYTGMNSAKAALERMCDPEAKVSAHYLIDEAGEITALIGEEHRAWHAGRACWAGETDINGCSIGIELQNPGHEFGYRSFPEAQMEALANLGQEILARHPIPPERVLGHSDVAPLRKQDPGELFDWDWLAGEGVGFWPDIKQETLVPDWTIRKVQLALSEIGYEVPVTGELDAGTNAVIKAFSRHFIRPFSLEGGVTEPLIRRLEDYLGSE